MEAPSYIVELFRARPDATGKITVTLRLLTARQYPTGGHQIEIEQKRRERGVVVTIGDVQRPTGFATQAFSPAMAFVREALPMGEYVFTFEGSGKSESCTLVVAADAISLRGAATGQLLKVREKDLSLPK